MSNLILQLTRFQANRSSYTNFDAYKTTYGSAMQAHIVGLVQQLTTYPDQPRGLSFARWKRGNNSAANLLDNNAIVLEYSVDVATPLADALAKMPWSYYLLETETRNGSRNTVSVIIPLATPVTISHYARIASVLAHQLDCYELELGCIAPSHIVHLHRMSGIATQPGDILEPSKFICDTKDLFQSRSARQFEKPRPVRNSAVQAQLKPTYFADDGLFSWPLSDADVQAQNAHQLIASLGYKPSA